MAKEQAAPPPAALPPGHPGAGAEASPRLKWTLPAGWEEIAPGEMRLASFRIQGEGGKVADVGVFPLPGMAGSDLDNVNRWRAQVGLPPVSAEELPKLAQPVEIAGQTAQLYDLAGQNPASGDKGHILAAVLRRDNIAWFFKMNGDDKVVAGQKTAFVDFLKSLSFPTPAAQAELPPSHPPLEGSGTMAMPAGAAAASSGQSKPVWQVPDGWREVPGGQFLTAKFVIAGSDNAQAAVNVSMSPGAGGGLAANVNRWRGQLGLGELTESELNQTVTTLEGSGGKATVVDLAGTDTRTGQKTRLIGAVVPQGGQTWFYKLMGNEQLVAREKDAFTSFVQTVKY